MKREIHGGAGGEVRKELSSCAQQSIPVFHLSPSTPAMASVWVLLGKARFQNAELSIGTNYKNKKFSTKAKNLILHHSWPGNARELFNTIMRICVWCPEKTIQEDDVQQALLPSHIQSKDDILQKTLVEGFKLQEILDVIYL